MIDIFGIKIITNYESINYEAIGLYAVSGGKSEIRYIETELTGLSESWKSGFLFANSFPTFSKSGSFVRGGNTVQLRSSTIRIKNTNRLQAILESDDYKINLIGASVEIIEFRGTDESTITETRNIFTGTIDSVNWSSTEMKIDVVPSRRKLRRSNIVTEGIPVTFGQSDPANGRFFKLLRTKDINEDLKVLDFTNDVDECYPKKMNLFPEIDLGGTTSSELRVCCRIGAYDNDIFTTLPDLLIGKYICVEEDNSTENLLSGLNRLIVDYVGNGVVEEIDIDGVHLYSVYVTLDLQDYLPVKPEGNSSGNHENQVWYKIKNVETEYQVETENVSGFYNSDTGESIDAPEIYTKENDRIEKLLSAACDIELSGKKVLFNPRMIKSDINKIQSLHIEPIKTLEEYNETNLERWGIEMADRKESGFYPKDAIAMTVSNYSGIGSDTSPVYDRNHLTYCQYRIDFESESNQYYVAFKFRFPDIPNNLKFDNVYLGIKASTVILNPGLPSFLGGSFIVKTMGHVNRLNTPVDADQVEFHPGTVLNAVAIDDIPDFYYTSGRSTGNKSFFVSQEDSEALTGLEKFDLGITNHDQYNNVTDGLILIKKFLSPTGTVRSGTESTSIHQLALIFEKYNNLGDEIYV